MNKILHILNGDTLSPRLNDLSIEGDIAIWREMLCEGKTVVNLASETFRNTRISFFKEQYPNQAGDYDTIFGSQLAIIADAHLYEEIILWFEFDLFCHINMLACISFLRSIGYKGKTFLVCSGWVDGKKQLQALTQLSNKELQTHYSQKIRLDKHDLFLADDLWRLYCENDHTHLNPKRAKDSNFRYLSNCISAHKERFPKLLTGLNTLETHLLCLIREHKISSKKQLCGYMLNYQGYYGYGDLQVYHIIERMEMFYTITNEVFTLTELAINVLDKKENVLKYMKDKTQLGGVFKYDYIYNNEDHQLTKM